MPWPPVDSNLQEGEGEDIALEEELARQAGHIDLCWNGGNWYRMAQPRSPGSSTITTGSLCPSSVWPVMRWSVFGGTVGGFSFAYSVAGRVLEAGGLQEAQGGQQVEQGVLDGWITSYGGLHHTAELGRTPTHSEVFARTHTRKEDQLWVNKRSADVNEAFLAELKRLQAERQALMEAGCPEPPPIDKAALWTRFAGGRKRGQIYGMGVVPSHQYPPLFPDDEDADTASGPPDLREKVVLLNREISQQAEANARRVAALESTVQTQSQEVSELRKAYADMYSLLTQMRSGG
ncbi:hypothetical protein PIB30_065212 [Stylosanthes scabra]|uniref:Uncharacterized protein n=1 Tax=Stylosanthes scabra TaxID=79078 RepID=A0ABU6TLN9_9FABA|nr:hypothetical protein [Stylosanthes scabra]